MQRSDDCFFPRCNSLRNGMIVRAVVAAKWARDSWVATHFICVHVYCLLSFLNDIYCFTHLGNQFIPLRPLYIYKMKETVKYIKQE
jgi:formate-dependent nitrite reductase membrane component NrfD